MACWMHIAPANSALGLAQNSSAASIEQSAVTIDATAFKHSIRDTDLPETASTNGPNPKRPSRLPSGRHLPFRGCWTFFTHPVDILTLRQLFWPILAFPINSFANGFFAKFIALSKRGDYTEPPISISGNAECLGGNSTESWPY